MSSADFLVSASTVSTSTWTIEISTWFPTACRAPRPPSDPVDPRGSPRCDTETADRCRASFARRNVHAQLSGRGRGRHRNRGTIGWHAGTLLLEHGLPTLGHGLRGGANG